MLMCLSYRNWNLYPFLDKKFWPNGKLLYEAQTIPNFRSKTIKHRPYSGSCVPLETFSLSSCFPQRYRHIPLLTKVKNCIPLFPVLFWALFPCCFAKHTLSLLTPRRTSKFKKCNFNQFSYRHKSTPYHPGQDKHI